MAILPPMSSLTKRTIATVGSGVMAEAMIAGLLRGKLVKPAQVVASHPRPERRAQLATDYGIRTVASNVEAVTGADIVLLAIKPQMLARVGREIGPHLGRGQLVLSIIASAITPEPTVAIVRLVREDIGGSIAMAEAVSRGVAGPNLLARGGTCTISPACFR